jgi:hypothetical protein
MAVSFYSENRVNSIARIKSIFGLDYQNSWEEKGSRSLSLSFEKRGVGVSLRA